MYFINVFGFVGLYLGQRGLVCPVPLPPLVWNTVQSLLDDSDTVVELKKNKQASKQSNRKSKNPKHRPSVLTPSTLPARCMPQAG